MLINETNHGSGRLNEKIQIKDDETDGKKCHEKKIIIEENKMEKVLISFNTSIWSEGLFFLISVTN